MTFSYGKTRQPRFHAAKCGKLFILALWRRYFMVEW